MIKTKKQMFTMIGAFLLVIMLGTITYAFFNYTRTGTANVIRTGRISFNANQTDTINLSNVFPIDKTTIGTDTANTDEVVISITGDTTYTDGIEYLVTAVDVNNTIGSGNNQKTVPISVSVTASNGLGTEDEEYFDNRENANSHLYRVLAGDVLEENGRIAVGYIKAGSTGVNGTLTIKAYLDKDKIAITDTYDGNESDNMGTTTDWVDNRTVLTTTEWNALQTNGVSFKVKVESNEGIWVEEIRTTNAMQHFTYDIYSQQNNIREIHFNKMGATRMQNAYDNATFKYDLTENNEGKVLAWLEENSDNNAMYNLIVASDGDTYFPQDSSGMFANMGSLRVIEFANVNTDRVTNMSAMFVWNNNLLSLDISTFNTSNVTNMASMFMGCNYLTSLNMEGIDTSHVETFTTMFFQCSNITILDLSEFDLSSIVNNGGYSMFEGCSNLEKIYVSNTWDMSNQIDGMPIFTGCTSLVGHAPNTSYAFDSNDAIDKTYAVIATDDTKGYLTDISLKPTN